MSNPSSESSGPDLAAALFVLLVVGPILIAAGIGWGVQPLAASFGVYVPFWPAFFTLLLVKFLISAHIKTETSKS